MVASSRSASRARQAAQEVESAAHRNGKQLHHPPGSHGNSTGHYQTAKKAGHTFYKEILTVVAASSLAMAEDADASPSEIAGAAVWDVARAIDPIFATTAIEHATGLNELIDPEP